MTSSGLAEPLCRSDLPKLYHKGTHRTQSPDDMLTRVRPLLGRMEITRLAEITGLDRVGVPVCQAVRPMARSLSVAQGKGLTLGAAMISAAMEAAEKFAAEDVQLPIAHGSMAEIPGALDLEALSPSVILDRARLAALPLSWVEGFRLTGGAPVWGPLDLVHMDLTLPAETQILNRSSNGLASGGTLAEAAAAAILELIERDATADFLALPVMDRGRRQIRPDALRAHPELGPLLARIAAAGLSLTVWDITGDLGIPAFLASVSVPPAAGHTPRPADGAGCHLDAAVALSRAITEALQSRLTVIAGARDDLGPGHYLDHGDVGRDRQFAAGFAAADARPPQLPDLSGASALADLAILARRLAAAGLTEVALFDLTHPEIGLPVVRALIPGLGHVLPHGRHLRGKRHKTPQE